MSEVKGQSARQVSLKTEDGVSIEARHYVRGNNKVILVAHGFFQNKDTDVLRKISESFLPQYDVFTLDFRGHGKSGGLFTLTARETLDLKCALEYLRASYQKVGVIGFSLGAALSLVVAAQTDLINSLIAVSAPKAYSKIDFHFWRIEAVLNLLDNLSPKAKGKGVRLGNPFLKKPQALDWAGRLQIPTLFIHGTHDWLVRPHHSRNLYEKVRSVKGIKIIERGLHAEKLFDQDPDGFKREALNWFQETL